MSKPEGQRPPECRFAASLAFVHCTRRDVPAEIRASCSTASLRAGGPCGRPRGFFSGAATRLRRCLRPAWPGPLGRGRQAIADAAEAADPAMPGNRPPGRRRWGTGTPGCRWAGSGRRRRAQLLGPLRRGDEQHVAHPHRPQVRDLGQQAHRGLQRHVVELQRDGRVRLLLQPRVDDDVRAGVGGELLDRRRRTRCRRSPRSPAGGAAWRSAPPRSR